jgi:hypothetical protein
MTANTKVTQWSAFWYVPLLVCGFALIYLNAQRETPDLATTNPNPARMSGNAKTVSAAATTDSNQPSESNQATLAPQIPADSVKTNGSAPTQKSVTNTTEDAISTQNFLQAMDDKQLVDWLLVQLADSQSASPPPPNLDNETFDRVFEQRRTGILLVIRSQAAAKRVGAASLLSAMLRDCAQTPAPGCPPAAEAQAEAERVDWSAAEAGEAYPMVTLWMDGTHRANGDYYGAHIATIERMRPIFEKNVLLGDCVALDWLAASYGLYVEIAQYRQPLLSYRFRFALLHAPFASQQYRDMARRQVARAQEQIRPELLRAEEKVALELVQNNFQVDTPNCKIGRESKFNFPQTQRR